LSVFSSKYIDIKYIALSNIRYVFLRQSH